jgi:hypothetical protein
MKKHCRRRDNPVPKHNKNALLLAFIPMLLRLAKNSQTSSLTEMIDKNNVKI